MMEDPTAKEPGPEDRMAERQTAEGRKPHGTPESEAANAPKEVSSGQAAAQAKNDAASGKMVIATNVHSSSGTATKLAHPHVSEELLFQT